MQNGRMLILEDDVHVGRVIKLISEAAGMQARLISATEDFFRALDEWKPTHIALDLVMPGMDGMEVLAALSDRACLSKIIITSGMGRRVLDAAGRAGHERGLDIIGVLAKPFSAAELRRLLTAAAKPPPHIHREAKVLIELAEHELKAALLNREFRPHYQPKIACDTGRLAGFEALARWHHPEKGIIPPDNFIPLMEKNGLINELTDLVLELALGWFTRAFGASTEITLSVNLSAKTFKDPAFLDRILFRCSSHGVPPERLILELTERDSMDDPLVSLDLMTRLRMKGFLLSIDDFGTGYSSLLQLVRLPFSEIKVDKSFVISANRSKESRAVVKSVVDLGRSLGLKSAAEGVEDRPTLDYLKQIGCDLAQGYAIARPMEGVAAEQWARTL